MNFCLYPVYITLNYAIFIIKLHSNYLRVMFPLGDPNLVVPID